MKILLVSCILDLTNARFNPLIHSSLIDLAKQTQSICDTKFVSHDQGINIPIDDISIYQSTHSTETTKLTTKDVWTLLYLPGRIQATCSTKPGSLRRLSKPLFTFMEILLSDHQVVEVQGLIPDDATDFIPLSLLPSKIEAVCEMSRTDLGVYGSFIKTASHRQSLRDNLDYLFDIGSAYRLIVTACPLIQEATAPFGLFLQELTVKVTSAKSVCLFTANNYFEDAQSVVAEFPQIIAATRTPELDSLLFQFQISKTFPELFDGNKLKTDISRSISEESDSSHGDALAASADVRACGGGSQISAQIGSAPTEGYSEMRLLLVNDGKLGADEIKVELITELSRKVQADISVVSEGVTSSTLKFVKGQYLWDSPIQVGTGPASGMALVSKITTPSKTPYIDLASKKAATSSTCPILEASESHTATPVLSLGYALGVRDYVTAKTKIIGMYTPPKPASVSGGTDEYQIGALMYACRDLGLRVLQNDRHLHEGTVIAGDLNSDWGEDRRFVLEAAMRSLGLKALNGDSCTYKKNGKDKNLDLIFASPNIRLTYLGFSPQLYFNDHRRIHADLIINHVSQVEKRFVEITDEDSVLAKWMKLYGYESGALVPSEAEIALKRLLEGDDAERLPWLPVKEELRKHVEFSEECRHTMSLGSPDVFNYKGKFSEDEMRKSELDSIIQNLRLCTSCHNIPRSVLNSSDFTSVLIQTLDTLSDISLPEPVIPFVDQMVATRLAMSLEVHENMFGWGNQRLRIKDEHVVDEMRAALLIRMGIEGAFVRAFEIHNSLIHARKATGVSGGTRGNSKIKQQAGDALIDIYAFSVDLSDLLTVPVMTDWLFTNGITSEISNCSTHVFKAYASGMSPEGPSVRLVRAAMINQLIQKLITTKQSKTDEAGNAVFEPTLKMYLFDSDQDFFKVLQNYQYTPSVVAWSTGITVLSDSVETMRIHLRIVNEWLSQMKAQKLTSNQVRQINIPSNLPIDLTLPNGEQVPISESLLGPRGLEFKAFPGYTIQGMHVDDVSLLQSWFLKRAYLAPFVNGVAVLDQIESHALEKLLVGFEVALPSVKHLSIEWMMIANHVLGALPGKSHQFNDYQIIKKLGLNHHPSFIAMKRLAVFINYCSRGKDDVWRPVFDKYFHYAKTDDSIKVDSYMKDDKMKERLSPYSLSFAKIRDQKPTQISSFMETTFLQTAWTTLLQPHFSLDVKPEDTDDSAAVPPVAPVIAAGSVADQATAAAAPVVVDSADEPADPATQAAAGTDAPVLVQGAAGAVSDIALMALATFMGTPNKADDAQNKRRLKLRDELGALCGSVAKPLKWGNKGPKNIFPDLKVIAVTKATQIDSLIIKYLNDLNLPSNVPVAISQASSVVTSVSAPAPLTAIVAAPPAGAAGAAADTEEAEQRITLPSAVTVLFKDFVEIDFSVKLEKNDYFEKLPEFPGDPRNWKPKSRSRKLAAAATADDEESDDDLD